MTLRCWLFGHDWVEVRPPSRQTRATQACSRCMETNEELQQELARRSRDDE